MMSELERFPYPTFKGRCSLYAVVKVTEALGDDVLTQKPTEKLSLRFRILTLLHFAYSLPSFALSAFVSADTSTFASACPFLHLPDSSVSLSFCLLGLLFLQRHLDGQKTVHNLIGGQPV